MRERSVRVEKCRAFACGGALTCADGTAKFTGKIGWAVQLPRSFRKTNKSGTSASIASLASIPWRVPATPEINLNFSHQVA